MELLNKFKDNQDIDVEQEIEEMNEQVAAAKSARVVQRRKDFENNILSEQFTVKVPEKYTRFLILDNGDIQYFVQECYLTGKNGDGIQSQDEWVAKFKTFFSNNFGGYNANKTSGGWVDESTGVPVDEECITIDSKCSKTNFKNFESKVINLAKTMAINLCQDTVFYDGSGKSQYIEGSHQIANNYIDDYSNKDISWQQGKIFEATKKEYEMWANK